VSSFSGVLSFIAVDARRVLMFWFQFHENDPKIPAIALSSDSIPISSQFTGAHNDLHFSDCDEGISNFLSLELYFTVKSPSVFALCLHEFRFEQAARRRSLLHELNLSPTFYEPVHFFIDEVFPDRLF
jgi:hypothetical protein